MIKDTSEFCNLDNFHPMEIGICSFSSTIFHESKINWQSNAADWGDTKENFLLNFWAAILGQRAGNFYCLVEWCGTWICMSLMVSFRKRRMFPQKKTMPRLEIFQVFDGPHQSSFGGKITIRRTGLFLWRLKTFHERDSTIFVTLRSTRSFITEFLVNFLLWQYWYNPTVNCFFAVQYIWKMQFLRHPYWLFLRKRFLKNPGVKRTMKQNLFSDFNIIYILHYQILNCLVFVTLRIWGCRKFSFRFSWTVPFSVKLLVMWWS